MKFSENWLREWINFQINSDLLHKQISNSGIEVETIKKFEPIIRGVVVGKIIQCNTHPKLNNLKSLKVDIGKKKLLNIICKANNCRCGIKVAVATIGATLPNNIKISAKLVNGEVSEGMLCSYFELGLFYTNKIIEFSQKTVLGTNVKHYLLLQDNIIQVSTTSNRPDGLSILGLARSISAINNTKIKSFKKILTPISIKKKISINIEAKNKCLRYLGRIIKNVDINVDTPFWMKKKLFLSDIPPVNIIKDIINYILIEIGQPLNVLDSDHINKTIIVRMAKDEERIILENKNEIVLNKKILVFSDINKVLFLPGNINSHIVSINEKTKNIFLSTYFIDKESIYYTIKNIKSNKVLDYYSYGVDPFLQSYAIEYATDLITKICGGIPGPITDKKVHFSICTRDKIRLQHKVINNVTGHFIEANTISDILYHLDYEFSFKETFWDVIPPSWRFDILIQEDVIGDILRIYGYNNIYLSPLKESLNFDKHTESKDLLLNKFSTLLINKGYYEVINYSFINPKIQNTLSPDKKKLLLSNPISKDMSCMRLSLWPGLLKNVSYNQNRQQQSIRIFESGICFIPDNKSNLGVKQEFYLAAVVSGNYIEENWYSKTRKIDFYDLKGDLECMLELTCKLSDLEFRHQVLDGLHPKQSASIYFQNNFIGSIGRIDPRLENHLKINSSTFLFEISLKNFSTTQLLTIQEISKFPYIKRDIAILISKKIPFSEVIKACKKIFIQETVEINLFDLYACKSFSSTKKSLGISFTFQDKNKTLHDCEINLMINNCINFLKKEFQITLRE